MRFTKSGIAAALRPAAFSLLMMSFGVPVGTTSPNHTPAS